MSVGLEGRGIVVTGGGSGIGAATCRLLALKGAAVGVLDRNADAARSVAEEIGGLALACDVGASDQVDAAIARADAELGGLTGLVNNAGLGNLKPLEDYSDRDVELIWRVNFFGSYACLRAAAPFLRVAAGRRREPSAVVNVASVSGVRPTRGEAPYSAAKAATVALTSSAALEWAPTVRVNCVSPGFIHTPLNDMLVSDEAARSGVEDRTPMGRVGSASETAGLIAFLLSDESSYITGQNVVIDGGTMLTNAQMDPVLGPLLELFSGGDPDGVGTDPGHN
ncbi:MAG TPA: SDR family oxidoreductase [Microthrixaceae bacterium]|nr:SDR family oxidoreductase [Microthrixaceae bacterium]